MACPPSAGPSGYTLRMYDIQPSAHSRRKLITQCINCLGNGFAFVQPDVIRETQFDTHLKIIGIMSIIVIIRIKTIICIRDIIVYYMVYS